MYTCFRSSSFTGNVASLLALLLPHSKSGLTSDVNMNMIVFTKQEVLLHLNFITIYMYPYSLCIPTTINEPHLACIIVVFENSHIHKPLQNNREHKNTASLFCWVPTLPYYVHVTYCTQNRSDLYVIGGWSSNRKPHLQQTHDQFAWSILTPPTPEVAF